MKSSNLTKEVWLIASSRICNGSGCRCVYCTDGFRKVNRNRSAHYTRPKWGLSNSNCTVLQKFFWLVFRCSRIRILSWDYWTQWHLSWLKILLFPCQIVCGTQNRALLLSIPVYYSVYSRPFICWWVVTGLLNTSQTNWLKVEASKCQKFGGVLQFVNSNVWDFVISWSPILLPLFQTFVTGSDQSGETACLASRLVPPSCCHTYHCQLIQAYSFMHYGMRLFVNHLNVF